MPTLTFDAGYRLTSDWDTNPVPIDVSVLSDNDESTYVDVTHPSDGSGPHYLDLAVTPITFSEPPAEIQIRLKFRMMELDQFGNGGWAVNLGNGPLPNYSDEFTSRDEWSVMVAADSAAGAQWVLGEWVDLYFPPLNEAFLASSMNIYPHPWLDGFRTRSQVQSEWGNPTMAELAAVFAAGARFRFMNTIYPSRVDVAEMAVIVTPAVTENPQQPLALEPGITGVLKDRSRQFV